MITIFQLNDLVQQKRNTPITEITTTDLSYQSLQAFYHSDIALFQDSSGTIKILKNRVTFEDLCVLIESMRKLVIESHGIPLEIEK